MALPIANPHPVIPNPVTFRVQAALPAAGAFDAAPIEVAVAGYHNLMLYITYDADADAVAPALQISIEASPYAADLGAPQESWFHASLYAAAVIVPGADAVSPIQREDVEYTAVGLAAEAFTYGPISLEGAVERLRIACAESGDTDEPGTCEIIGVLYE